MKRIKYRQFFLKLDGIDLITSKCSVGKRHQHMTIS